MSCPLNRDKKPEEKERSFPSFTLPQLDGCPMHHNGQNPKEVINPLNMMPDLPNQQLSDQQQMNLSTRREISTIPKTNAEGNWEYPSPQQFYNAMLRKNKSPDASLMNETVYVHNIVNDQSWHEIVKWEKKYHPECANITLQRFTGRYDDMTIRAYFKQYFTSLGRPFDRHDWYIDRCGKNVRYIIDYYDDSSKNDSIDVTIDARPAIFDSLTNLKDNVFNWFSS